jgi:hypothetical protein
MIRDREKPTTLDYATPVAASPGDKSRDLSLEKLIFAVGCGMLAFGICASMYPRSLEFAVTAGIGAALMGLTFPWPRPR